MRCDALHVAMLLLLLLLLRLHSLLSMHPPIHVTLCHVQVVCQLVKVATQHILLLLLLLLLLQQHHLLLLLLLLLLLALLQLLLQEQQMWLLLACLLHLNCSSCCSSSQRSRVHVIPQQRVQQRLPCICCSCLLLHRS
jgi:hypothetical protein